tara:strand:+ start:3688 stop:4521 length:834 start_codon:yes stop_codon:yes gene_type:complete
MMASVQLSQRLREDIKDNFKVQLEKAYRKSFNVQPSIDAILDKMQNSSPELQKLISMEREYQIILPKIQSQYDSSVGSYHSRIDDNIIRPQTSLGLICNPKRPESDNMTTIKQWEVPHEDEYTAGQWNEGKSFVEGDIAVKLDNVDEFYYPLTFGLSYYRGWRDTGPYQPHVTDGALIVTDKELCEAFSPIGEIEQRIGEETATFADALAKKNTLKQFLDDWPAGRNLVPHEDMQRMIAPKTKTSTGTKKVTVNETIPEELKDSMNEVILGNKLMGE